MPRRKSAGHSDSLTCVVAMWPLIRSNGHIVSSPSPDHLRDVSVGHYAGPVWGRVSSATPPANASYLRLVYRGHNETRRKGAAMGSANDVAAYILSKTGPVSAMKMQKLCYYSQAWSLVWDEEPLFTDRIEAWANGPVVRSLYAQHRGQSEIHSWPSGNPDNLTLDQKASIDAVLDAYSKLTAQQLSDLTHSEQPWIAARAGLPATVRSEAEITRDSMCGFYASLAGRADTDTV